MKLDKARKKRYTLSTRQKRSRAKSVTAATEEESREAVAPEPPWKELFQEALEQYQLGVGGDAEAVGKAVSLLEQVRSMEPDNNLVNAYYGAALVLSGRDLGSSTEKFRNVMNGLKVIDQCVEREPENPEIRLLRGYVNQRLPELYFHRTAKAVEDFGRVAEAYERDPSILPQDMYWSTLYEWGAAGKKMELYPIAQKAWSKLLAVSTDERYQQLLKREQRILGGQFKQQEERDPEEQSKKRWERELPQEGLQQYQQALEGDKEAAFRALELFNEAYERKKSNPLLQAYYADALSLTGKYQQDVPSMIGVTIKSMRIFDRLVHQYPENVRLRLLRAYHSFRLPETFFHRSATAIEDFQILLSRCQDDPELLPEEAYWQILFDLGAAYYRMGMKEEARQAWEPLRPCPDPRFQELLEAQPADELPDYSAYSQEELFAEGRRLHQLAVSGNRRAVSLARECWRIAHEAYPWDAVAQAYYGSALALSAREGVEPEQIFRTTFQGLNLLDDAVEQEPENVEVRMLRAFVLRALPRTFFPSHRAVEDLQALQEMYQRDPGAFSQEQYEKVVEALNQAAEGEMNAFSGLEVQLSPVIRNLLSGKVMSK